MILSYLQWQIMAGFSAQVNPSVYRSKGKRIVELSISKPFRLVSSFNSVPVSGNPQGEIYYSIRTKK